MTLGEQSTVDRPAAFETARQEQSSAAPSGPGWQRACARLTEDARFGGLVIAVILANAVTLGLGTFPPVARDAGKLLQGLDNVFLGFFCAELLIRVAAVGFRPDRFLRRGWNLFDLIAVGASFVPGLGTNGTALRLVRLLRVTRLLTVLPEVPVLLSGLRRAARPVAGILLLTLLLMYLYGVVGWALFHHADPQHWGTLGVALLSLFQLLTHRDWNTLLDPIREHSPLAAPFAVSFILVGAFLVVQFLVAVLLAALETAREAHRETTPPPAQRSDLEITVEAMRQALDRLERLAAARARKSATAPERQGAFVVESGDSPPLPETGMADGSR